MNRTLSRRLTVLLGEPFIDSLMQEKTTLWFEKSDCDQVLIKSAPKMLACCSEPPHPRQRFNTRNLQPVII